MKYIKTFESVSSQKNIEIIANDILLEIAKLSIKAIKDINGVKHIVFMILRLKDIDKEKYDEITKDFINQTNLKIVLTRINDNTNIEGTYDRVYSMITLNYTDDFKENINHELNNPTKYGEHISYYDERKLYFDLYFKFYSTLIHELQHAWDDWVSKGKYRNTKKWNKYVQNKKEFNLSFNKDVKKEFQIHNQYIKLPQEINARFTQAIKEIKFWKLDDKWKAYKLPFNDVINDFKRSFVGWDSMTPAIQKRLLHRLYQFYQADYQKPKEIQKFKNVKE